MQPGPPYQQNPYGGQPGYPQQGYPQPGYPGYPPPKKGMSGVTIALIIVGALIVVSGLGVGAFFLIDGKSSSSSASPTSTVKTGPPDKYTTLPPCTSIEAKMSGMPKLDVQELKPAGTSDTDISLMSLACEWREPGKSSGSLSLYMATSKRNGSGDGEESAKAEFEHYTQENSELVPTLSTGAKAAYVSHPNYPGACSIRFYQGNVSGSVMVSSADGNPIDVGKCRANAKKLAEATSEVLG
ncbi:Protein of unknown function [Amycolatopsis xylanica]|uniref:DUF3558 domain-containing protein n=1 Tax=Amycolatopsis xylanica TaxID=589385 RepID=A0A1H3E3X6_9PSEU|nr:hypothetical protein [Amycolatopsis xylanica]SDX73381.1 Protein of unknown function [Amycolatopsis xylanica]